MKTLHPASATQRILRFATLSLATASLACAGTPAPYILVAQNGNSARIDGLAAHATARGVVVSGSVQRTTGSGAGTRALCVRVLSPSGQELSAGTVRATFPDRRPIVAASRAAFAKTVQAAPGSTIIVSMPKSGSSACCG